MRWKKFTFRRKLPTAALVATHLGWVLHFGQPWITSALCGCINSEKNFAAEKMVKISNVV